MEGDAFPQDFGNLGLGLDESGRRKAAARAVATAAGD